LIMPRFTRGAGGYVDGHSLLTYYELYGTNLSPQSRRRCVVEGIASRDVIDNILSVRLCLFNGELCGLFYPLLGTEVSGLFYPLLGTEVSGGADPYVELDDVFNFGSASYWRFP